MLFVMSRGLPLLLELGLLIFCVIDVLQTPDGAHRNLPKGWWLLLVIVLPLVGGIAWLVAGRPAREDRGGGVTGFPESLRPTATRRSLAPDDDPDFLRELGRVNAEQEQARQKQEEDLARREEELRRRESGDEPGVS